MPAELIPYTQMIERYSLEERYLIDGTRVSIGRSRHNDISIDTSSVSRRHATLIFVDDHWHIENHSEANPVHVNGNAHDRVSLQTGDTIQLGELLFGFRDRVADKDDTRLVERTFDTPFDRDRGGVFQALIDLFEALPEGDGESEAMARLSSLVSSLVPNDQIMILRIKGAELFHHESGNHYTATVIERCRETGNSVLWRDEIDDPSISTGGYGIHSAICAPVARVQGEPYGYLYLHRTEVATLTESDLDCVRALSRLTGTVIENLRLREEQSTRISELEHRIGSASHGGKIVGKTMLRMMREAKALADSSAKILIRGATGTGKDVLARLVHDVSHRADGPYVAVNCAAIPASLLEAELFGYGPQSGIANADPKGRRGYFEQAHEGTLFLDEIGDMPWELQRKVLRALESSSVVPLGSETPIDSNVRIVSATNQDLEQLIEAGEFRTDLFHRLRGVELFLPTLAERAEEIRELAEHFAAQFLAEQSHGDPPTPLVTDAALSRLESYDWPGNVRDLRNTIQHAAVLSRGATIDRVHLRLPEDDGTSRVRARFQTLAEIEKAHISAVLEAVNGNRTRAAEILGIHRNTLTQKIQRYGLDDN